ncbi:hypothetical protein QP902_10040 [Corynebacterium marquesiae]|uniref:hypothetical protein n=1 Tax=Corynebacterium marquesiae TaxID=2913503 RepID=UPI0025503F45|nr:hypothetical protein [Corynebacterium marquesiae]MDK8669011.1 hypothetical protein [Corynebacterium marquesiae]
MPKDSRLYANITHDFFESPKIMVLSDRAKLGLLEMILWSCRMQTDGVIDHRVASAKHLLDVCQELLENDPETPSLVELENGDFLIHDFTEHQTTRAEIEAIREKRRAAGRAGGLAKSRSHAAKSSKRVASATASAKHGAKQTASKPVAKGVAKSSKKKNKKGGGEQAKNTANVATITAPTAPTSLDELAAAHAASQPDPRRCPEHQHLAPGTVPNCGQCAEARRAHDERQETADAEARARRAEERRRADECPYCEGGWVKGTNPAQRCNHKPPRKQPPF